MDLCRVDGKLVSPEEYITIEKRTRRLVMFMITLVMSAFGIPWGIYTGIYGLIGFIVAVLIVNVLIWKSFNTQCD